MAWTRSGKRHPGVGYGSQGRESLVDKHGCSGPILAVFAGLWVLVVLVGTMSLLSGQPHTAVPSEATALPADQ